MHPEITILHMDVSPGRRLLVTSDIHGHLNHLKAVLAKAAFCEEDLLIIVGDILEKGPESLNTLRYVMELYQKGNVVVLAGNVDFWRIQMFDNLHTDTAADFLDYLRRMREWKGTSFYDEMTKELGFIAQNPVDLIHNKVRIAQHFKKEFDFLRCLPTILETQNYTFVHGGLPDKDIHALAGRNVLDVLKYDNFMATSVCFDKYVVVGHWPVSLYGDSIPQFNPLFNNEQKIIAIDGGCGLKDDGQLNLLVIPDMDCPINAITYFAYDDLPIYRAKKEQEASTDSIHIRWTDNNIHVLERREDFTFVEHSSSGRRLWVYNAYLYGENHCDDYTDYVLPVQCGDKLSLILQTSMGSLVKKDGVSGWYFGELEMV